MLYIKPLQINNSYLIGVAQLVIFISGPAIQKKGIHYSFPDVKQELFQDIAIFYSD